MNLHKLKIFCETVKAGSFDRVASIFNIHKTGVGKSIRDLEKELGVKLLVRGYGDIHLSEAGKKIYEVSKNIFFELDNLENQIKLGNFQQNKIFKIASSIGLGSTWLPYYTKDFFKNHSDLEIFFYTFLNDLEAQVDSFDVLIYSFISNKKNLVQKELFNFEFNLYGTKSYFKKNGLPKTIADLKSHTIIKYDTDSITPFYDLDIYLEDNNFFDLFDNILTVNNSVIEHGLLKTDQGLAMTTNQWPGDDIELVKIFSEEFSFKKKIFFIYETFNKGNIIIDSFYDYLLKKLKHN